MNKLLFNKLGWNDFFEKQFSQTEFVSEFPARVISQQANIYTILSERGEYIAKITGKFRFLAKQIMDYPVVGDFVIAGQAENSESINIHKVLERKNYFSRKMPISGGRKLKNGVLDGGITEEQIIASNIDTVFIVCGLDENFNIPRIERYLTLVKHQNLQSVILLNKCDVCEKPEEYIHQVTNIANDIPVMAVSAITKKGLEQLSDYISVGKTVVFLGSSGVGKSTLLNSLFGEQIQLTNSISQFSGKGKHTTTHKQMFFHSSGCMIIDTPGMKELQLWANDEDLDFVYPDIVQIINCCKFSNCTHKNEIGCAVREALETGTLSKERYARYLNALKEIKRLDERKREYQVKLIKRGKSK